MQFFRDLLIMDFETTGLNPAISEPIQIGAVLLDRQTLKEISNFNSFIFTDLSNTSVQFISDWHINIKEIATAPKMDVVAKSFVDQFGFDIILGSWVEHLDRRMLQKILKSIDIDIMNFDYHYLDIWPVAYAYLVQRGYEGKYDSDSMFSAFGFAKRQRHDALEDARMAAEVLREIMKDGSGLNGPK